MFRLCSSPICSSSFSLCPLQSTSCASPIENCPQVSPVTSLPIVKSSVLCSVPIRSICLHLSFSGLLSLDYFPSPVTTPIPSSLSVLHLPSDFTRQISPSLLIALRISTSSQGISHLFRGKSLGNRLFPL